MREQQANKGRRKKNKEQKEEGAGKNKERKGEGAEEKQAKKGRRSGRKTS